MRKHLLHLIVQLRSVVERCNRVLLLLLPLIVLLEPSVFKLIISDVCKPFSFSVIHPFARADRLACRLGVYGPIAAHGLWAVIAVAALAVGGRSLWCKSVAVGIRWLLCVVVGVLWLLERAQATCSTHCPAVVIIVPTVLPTVHTQLLQTCVVYASKSIARVKSCQACTPELNMVGCR